MRLKRRAKSSPKRQRPRRKPSTAALVAGMAQSGLNEDQVAGRLGISKNTLRARHIDAYKSGKAAAAASEADAAALTPAQYHFLRAVEISFADGSWIGSDGRNLLYNGVDGEGARSIEDAYAAWNGRFNTSGLGTRFDPVKAARYAAIVNDCKNNIEQEIETE
jgi:hypothetical protein